MIEHLTDRRWKRFLLLALSAVFTGLTLIFPKIGPVEWLTLVPAGIFLLSEADGDRYRARGMYGYGFFFFMCFYAVVFHWFVNMYPLEFIDGITPSAAIAVVLAGCLGLSAFQAVFGGLAFVVIRYIFRTHLLREHKALRPFAAAAVWTVYEWTQTLGWWGVPWGRLAIGQSEYVVGLQTASLFGSYAVSLALLTVNFYIAYAVLNRNKVKLSGIVVASVLVFQYGVGALLYVIPRDGEENMHVAAVQGNISSSEKWDADSRTRTFEVYTEYTLSAAENGADIVVWPETALPYTVEEGNAYGEYCSALARRAGVTILVGCFTENGEGEQLNSVVCVLPDGSFHETVYSKRHLVPFGEFVPMRELFKVVIPPLAELVMSDDDIAVGEGSQVIALDGVNIGSLICFDSIYENLARDSTLDGAQLICLPTNDSWFTDSAALYMHNAQAQLRAIENGRCVVRAANTGISTVISSKGDVLTELDPLVSGVAEYSVPINSHMTLYTLIGNFLIFALCLALIILTVCDIVYRLDKKCQTPIDKIENV